jgi:hypothetical protein
MSAYVSESSRRSSVIVAGGQWASVMSGRLTLGASSAAFLWFKEVMARTRPLSILNLALGQSGAGGSVVVWMMCAAVDMQKLSVV